MVSAMISAGEITRLAIMTVRVIPTAGTGVHVRLMMVVQTHLLNQVQPTDPLTGRPTDQAVTTQNGHSQMLTWPSSIAGALMPGSYRNTAAQIVANQTKLIIHVNPVSLLIQATKTFWFLNLLVFQITMPAQNHPRRVPKWWQITALLLVLRLGPSFWLDESWNQMK